MPFIMQREDLRSIKTRKSLFAAIYTLLKKNNFKRLTVGDICEEALISRATFYAHYTDKYDFLKYWLENLTAGSNIMKENVYENTEKLLNEFIMENKIIIKNLITDIEQETSNILFDFILSYFNLTIDEVEKIDIEKIAEKSDTSEKIKKSDNKKTNQKYIVLSNFFAGGMLQYLSWHVNNKFPSDVINIFLYEIIQNFQEWKLQE